MNLEKLSGEVTILDNKNACFSDWKVKWQDTPVGALVASTEREEWEQKKSVRVCVHVISQ